MKIIAFYLPQFHSFKENDDWWGKDFTEWNNVKTAKVLFRGHNQPRKPLNDNYYDLSDVNVIRWQSALAKEYGIYGFCYYHYWFDGKLLMEKPIELMLKNKDIQFPFCISWANENWTRTWAEKNNEVLIKQDYGNEEDWINHFQYLLQFFTDSRYIKENNKPLFIIYRPELIHTLRPMLQLWDELARQNGFDGIAFLYQFKNFNHLTSKNGDLFDYGIEYQPVYSRKNFKRTPKFLKKYFKNLMQTILKKQLTEDTAVCFDYDKAWKVILNTHPRDEKMIPGAFVDWDNTPRHKKRGSIYLNVSSEKFERYLTKQVERTKEVYGKDMLFLFAWNEWGEGGYLEPDELYGFEMLEAIRNALRNNNEFPKYREE